MGNPNWIKGGASPNPYGRTAGQRIAARNLAITIRDKLAPAEAYWWLRCVAAGIDPDYVESDGGRVWERAARDGRVPSEGVLATVDWSSRMKAKTMILERGWGQPAQHVIVEAEIRAQLEADTEAGDDEMAALDDAQLEALAALDRARKRITAGAAVIDATSTEAE